MEPIDEKRRPTTVGAGVPVLRNEVASRLYQPRPEDWGGDRDSECDRISSELKKLMNWNIAVPFSSPVDLKLQPSYASIVEYPMDLSTIKARLDNRFYRRASAVEFDVNYIFINASKFYQPESDMVRYASIITEDCMNIIRKNTAVAIPKIRVEGADENAGGPSTSGASAKENETPNQPKSRSELGDPKSKANG